MPKPYSNRRKFLRDAATVTGMGLFAGFPGNIIAADNYHSDIDPTPAKQWDEPRIKFSVIGINHGHIYGQVGAVIRGGGQLVSLYAKEPELVAEFTKRYPQVKVAASEKEILEDKSVQLILSAAIPVDRAGIGIRVMQHGKDYMSDKPGITTLEQLEEVRKVQKQTNRIYSIMYSERFENKATVKAGELVKEGAIGNVIQTVVMAPHRMGAKDRPQWFFDKKYFGGVITDIGSHQFDQFLYFTNSDKADIIASQVGNVAHPQYPQFEDFGDIMLRGNGGAGYIRVDWFTPDGLKTWGDGRLTILGTKGYIEVRKNIDIAVHPNANHLYLVNDKDTQYIDCNNVELPYGKLLVDDVLNRTETAMTQHHCFLATELALKAQKNAQKLNYNKA
ncbi:oxidoreductase [Niastella koreensis]|uniref:Oxidoreductase domain protein n=2 Tax=Niastella koreensis TaxID=354356 RepID=G8TN19_NIAKG|nr:Gfo/Idh/MocA family oxidoreductase [Niastella koreensis]AEV97704.1 oxidoreductase domain protein [Niastella koreensis GR20-10]OQP40475.1 oxidoreductase [Niastella koreensis]